MTGPGVSPATATLSGISFRRERRQYAGAPTTLQVTRCDRREGRALPVCAARSRRERCPRAISVRCMPFSAGGRKRLPTGKAVIQTHSLTWARFSPARMAWASLQVLDPPYVPLVIEAIGEGPRGLHRLRSRMTLNRTVTLA